MNTFLFASEIENTIIKRFLRELVKEGWATETDKDSFDLRPIAIIFEPYDNRITIK